jgi:hypothetical protein
VATLHDEFAAAIQSKCEFCCDRNRLGMPGPLRVQYRAPHGRPRWHNVCFKFIRLGVTRFQASSSRGFKAAVSGEDAVRNMDNNGGTRARTFTEMA